MIIWGERNGFNLVPFQRFRPKLEAIPEGVRLRISIDQDRNGKFNALFHVMLELVVSAINSGPAKTDLETLKKWIKLKKGWFDLEPLPSPAIGPNGETVSAAIVYRSTSFSKMGEAEFEAFCRDACEMVRSDMAPWIAQAPEWPEIEAIIQQISPR